MSKLFLQSLFISFFFIISSGYTNNITANLALTESDTIVSSGKVYILGFFSPENTTDRYLGIWNYVSAISVIWVANRDKPLKDTTGFVTISEDGNLLLMNGNNEISWSSNVSNPPLMNTTAQLLDNGNLVLQDNSNGKIIWESFGHPTDAFMPKMKLNDNPKTGNRVLLTSWRSLQDPDYGLFTAGLQALNVPQIFIWNGSHPHWRSGPWNGQILTGVTDMYPVYLDGYSVTKWDDGTTSFTRDYYGKILMKIILKPNGSFVQTMWDVNRSVWNVTWVAPIDVCDVYAKCGPFGYCNLRNSPMCSCLKGYVPKNKEEWGKGNWSGGCVRKTMLQCDRNSSLDKSKVDVFWKITNVKVPDFMDVSTGLRGEECEGLCLQNCSCIAYSHDSGIGCMFWKRSLIDVRQFPVGGSVLQVRVAYSEIDKNRDKRWTIIISSTIGSIVVFICVFLAWWCMAKRRGAKRKGGVLTYGVGNTNISDSSGVILRDDINEPSLDELPLFSFEILANATSQFDVTNLLGKGGFGPVYKGKLGNGKDIAVKRLSRASGQGLQEFMNEVVVISKLQHRNLVSLLGCCVEKEEKMLIYEYMTNRSLDLFLFDGSKEILDWTKRSNIIEGIGRGVLYLHRDSRLRIVHRDLKPSNILLGEDWNPKISDFGMARIFGGNQDQANTARVVGTYGYMAPEYAIGGKFSEKSDVFSFGVLMLEIISGTKNTSFYNDEPSLSLLGYAWKLWNEDNAVALVDERISSPSFLEEMVRCIHIGLLCVQEFPLNRPNISTVLSMLCCEIIDLPSPRQPAFTQNWTRSHVSSPPLSSQSHWNTCGASNSVTITTLQGR